MPRYSSTVWIASAAPPNAYAALILFWPWPGMSTTVSRRIESWALAPPPTRRSMIESDRLVSPIVCAPGSAFSFVRASEPSTRIVFGVVSGKPPPLSWASAASEILADWIWALIRNTTSETSSHAATPIAR